MKPNEDLNQQHVFEEIAKMEEKISMLKTNLKSIKAKSSKVKVTTLNRN